MTRNPLGLSGPVGPGFANRPDDLARVFARVEAVSGASPFARLPAGLDGEYGPAGEDMSDEGLSGLTVGALGAIKATQIVRGTDPDGIVLVDGPTAAALASAGGAGDKPAGFAPIPKIKRSVGPGGVNRPEDVAVANSKFARLGYAQPTPDPNAPGFRRIDPNQVTSGALAYQRDHGLAADGKMTPGGPTERAVDGQIGRQQKALVQTLEAASSDLDRRARASDPAVKRVTDAAEAKAMAGATVGKVAERQRRERLTTVAGGPYSAILDRARVGHGDKATVVPVQHTDDRRGQSGQRSVPPQAPSPADRNSRQDISPQDPSPIDALPPYPDIAVEPAKPRPHWRTAPVLTKWQRREKSILADTPARIAGFVGDTADRVTALLPAW